MSESSLDQLGGSTTVGRTSAARSSAGLVYRTLHRTVDVVLSATLLVLLLPVFLVCALAIKLESPGPVFYKATRVGWRSRPLRLLKFRKMHDGATVTC